MERSPSWCELYRTNDPTLAHTLATCIEGMEFDVRVHDSLGRSLEDSTSEAKPDRSRSRAEAWSDARNQAAIQPPFVIAVHEEHWASLREVLDELIAEQTEFDSKLEAQQQRSMRVAQLLVLSAVTLVASFVGASMLKQCEVERP